jgi:hypothetical protein
MDEARAFHRPAGVQRLLERVEHEAGMGLAAEPQPTMRRAKALITKAT